MKFTVPRDILLKGIQLTQNAINPKSTLPILSNILIEANENNTVFTATDLDIGIISTLEIKPSIVGSVTIPAAEYRDWETGKIFLYHLGSV